MRFEKVKCYSQIATLIATGVPGGGYVGLKGALIGGEEWLTDDSKCVQIPDTPDFFKIYLQEGEKIYGKGGSTTYPKDYGTYSVIYYNSEPSSQDKDAPLIFTGSISLSQN